MLDSWFVLLKISFLYFSEELKSQYTLLVKLLDREFIFQPGQTDQVLKNCVLCHMSRFAREPCLQGFLPD